MRKKEKVEGIELDFLLLRHPTKKGWTYKKAKSLVRYLRTSWNIKNIAIKVGFSEASCKQLIVELKKAAKAKMTLEVYFEKGRPFRVGRKVIA